MINYSISRSIFVDYSYSLLGDDGVLVVRDVRLDNTVEAWIGTVRVFLSFAFTDGEGQLIILLKLGLWNSVFGSLYTWVLGVQP